MVAIWVFEYWVLNRENKWIHFLYGLLCFFRSWSCWNFSFYIRTYKTIGLNYKKIWRRLNNLNSFKNTIWHIRENVNSRCIIKSTEYPFHTYPTWQKLQIFGFLQELKVRTFHSIFCLNSGTALKVISKFNQMANETWFKLKLLNYMYHIFFDKWSRMRDKKLVLRRFSTRRVWWNI